MCSSPNAWAIHPVKSESRLVTRSGLFTVSHRRYVDNFRLERGLYRRKRGEASVKPSSKMMSDLPY